MIKKEISEIKKQFTPDRCTISRMRGCYVNGEKEKVTTLEETFMALPEEELHKYLDIFKKTLSGTLGKNLLNMDFPLDSEMEGGPHHFLMKLRESELKEDTLLDEFYNKIIASYPIVGNYLILLIYASYDVPGKGSDELEMLDASDEVYQYVLCSICPVTLTKPGLGYDTLENAFHNRLQDWVVEMPASGFLFPAFHDRSTDIHSLLFYTKKPEELSSDFIQDLFGCVPPLTAGTQKETFQAVLEETFGDEADFQIICSIHTQLNEMLEAHEEPEPLVIQKSQVKELLEESGAEEETLQVFDRVYDKTAGEDTAFQVSNIVNTRTFEVKTPEIVIKVNPEHADLIETKEIDGRLCLVIPVDDHLELNGISVKGSK